MIKFQIPLSANLTDEQITDIEEDINKRIQALNQNFLINEPHFKLDNYSINIIVVVREIRSKGEKDESSMLGLADFIMGDKK